jgi:hypothetical protein
VLDVVVCEEEDSVELADSVDVSLNVDSDLEVLESEESEESDVDVDVDVDVEASRESLEVSSGGVLSLGSLLSEDSVGDVGSGLTTISCCATLAR